MKLFVATLMLAVAAVAADGGRSSFGLSSRYGAPQMNGGALQGYGAPQMNGGGASQGYGAPRGNSGASQSYGAPQGNSGVSQSYGAPQGNSGASQRYGAPQGNSGASQIYGAPQGNSGASQRYGAPQGNSRQSFQSYGSSQRNTGQTFQGYGAPQSSNNQASQSYGGQQGGQQNSYGTAEESYPPQPYSFEYNVQDNQGNDYGHEEESDGSRVEGEYRVLLPDSRMQTVTYYVDGDSGFVAEVTYEGEAQFPEDEQHQYDQFNSAAGAAPSTGYGAPGGVSLSQTPIYRSTF